MKNLVCVFCLFCFYVFWFFSWYIIGLTEGIDFVRVCVFLMLYSQILE